jgi:3-methyladenine DNA glycosylase AlkC
MTHEIRVPKKSAGVPREERGGTLVSELCRALDGRVDGAAFAAEVERRGFYQASLMGQARLLADAVAEAVERGSALEALEAAQHERVRGLAPFVVSRAFSQELETSLRHLRRQAAVPGTWIQEGAQVALKALIVAHGLDEVLPMVAGWASDPAPEVRRCLVEGLRPRGVWTAHILELRRDPAPLRPVLERVLDDPSLYVRKAAANCLNDVSKDNPEPLLIWAAEWLSGEPGAARRWVLKQGLRTLVRAGHAEAQRLLGFSDASALEAEWISELPGRVSLHQLLNVEVRVRNPSAEDASVIVFGSLSGPGKGPRPRVWRYQIGKARVGAGGEVRILGRIHFTDFNSQRKLPGTYSLMVEVNGRPVETRQFAYGAT